MIYGSDQVFRVGSSIISGVGFLCSGVIFKDCGTVRGMNTAATLWCTAAIGILASTGMYTMAVFAAGISCKTLYLNHLESGDVVGDKVEIIAKYCSAGKPKSNILEGIVGQVLELPAVISAGWEVL